MLLAALLVIGLSPVSVKAHHTSFHHHATGQLSRNNFEQGVTAVRQYRPDIDIPSNACVFQSTWLTITNDGINFLEIGTAAGSNCTSIQGIVGGDWYWLYRSSAGWFVLGSPPHGPGPNHTFYIAYSSFNGGGYSIGIDITNMAFVPWPGTYGRRANVGLETYDPNAAMQWYSGTQLDYAWYGSAWQSWASGIRTPDQHDNWQGLCGFFVSATEWRATETPGNPFCD